MITKCYWVARQTREAAQNNYVTDRRGISIPLFMAYRCLYCGEYFAQTQAEEHFGTIRAGYNHSTLRENLIEITVKDSMEKDNGREAENGLHGRI